jgi:hypothetical protein
VRKPNMKKIALLGVGRDGTVAIALAHAVSCACERMVMLVVNRDGKTRCVDCDAKYRKEKEAGNVRTA